MSEKQNMKVNQSINLGSIIVDVEHKDIKNIHLSVYPPIGRVKIAAPLRLELDTIRMFAISKLGWIKKQQIKLQKQSRETPREFKPRESHYVWGKRYLLHVVELDGKPMVTIKHDKIVLQIRPETTYEQKQAMLQEWYRDQLKAKVPKYIAKWENRMLVYLNGFNIRKMKTRWGTCNPERKQIRINLELAKKPLECLEYIVVHEMVHLLERRHNERFTGYMDKFLPGWRHVREELNRMPVGHEDWKY